MLDDGAVAGWFSPAISPPTDEVGCVSYRRPRWYAVRFGQINEALIVRLLNLVGLPYKIFTYQHQVGRRRATTRSWLPGYMFVEFDVLLDEWRQILRIPGIIEVLGDPTPLDYGKIEELIERLPSRLPKNDPGADILIGSTVRILNGVFRDHVAKVCESGPNSVKLVWMMFERVITATLRPKDVVVVE